MDGPSRDAMRLGSIRQGRLCTRLCAAESRPLRELSAEHAEGPQVVKSQDVVYQGRPLRTVVRRSPLRVATLGRKPHSANPDPTPRRGYPAGLRSGSVHAPDPSPGARAPTRRTGRRWTPARHGRMMGRPPPRRRDRQAERVTSAAPSAACASRFRLPFGRRRHPCGRARPCRAAGPRPGPPGTRAETPRRPRQAGRSHPGAA